MEVSILPDATCCESICLGYCTCPGFCHYFSYKCLEILNPNNFCLFEFVIAHFYIIIIAMLIVAHEMHSSTTCSCERTAGISSPIVADSTFAVVTTNSVSAVSIGVTTMTAFSTFINICKKYVRSFIGIDTHV